MVDEPATSETVHEPAMLLRPKDVHERYGIGKNEVYEAIHSGQLKAFRPDGTKRGYWIKPPDLAEWLEKRMVQVN